MMPRSLYQKLRSKLWAPDMPYCLDYIGAEGLGPYYIDLSTKGGEPGVREAHGAFCSPVSPG